MYSVKKVTVKDKKLTIIEVKQPNISITFMDYGATILELFVPDKNKKMENVVIAYKTLESYFENEMYLNAIIGPTSGRIKNATFKINNQKYTIDKNFLKTENLHGGKECFAFKVFDYEIIDNLEETKVIFSLTKKAEDSLYPGNQNIKIIYTIKNGALLIEFTATTDQDTLLNLTNHAYFNLSGNLKTEILNHYLFVASSTHLDLDEKFVPFKISENKNTRFDFLTIKKIKNNFYEGIYDLKTKGIDEPFLLDKQTFDIPQVIYYDDESKRKLEVYTTYPSIVIYTHNYPDNKELANEVENKRHLGICFETQLPPNGINIDELDKGILLKGKQYYYKTKYQFSVQED